MSERRAVPGFGGGWPGNELEEALAASVGVPDAAPKLLKVLSRSAVWVPLPEGGGPDSQTLDLPTIDLAGGVYVPVFSSAEQLRLGGAAHLPFTVAPAWEFARGLPPQVGIAVNPGGTVGIPVPPGAVGELCRGTPGERTPGVPSGARMRLFQPDWQEDPVDFLTTAAAELAALWPVRTARRGLASAEGAEPALFVGVELEQVDDETREAVNAALGRALARHAVKWPVQLVLLDAAQDPVVDWLRECVAPFYSRAA
ncbi:enhanced serine sensitivity protein SseB C-terminal domain-containing protein [Streptomyces sp. DSM 44915]|uniref:Enhanced serine sensitivity protein SseB C-terminal domain-containing protein n=1 Tax=Streptomyces chisholmiae TaxID=3075540 RepID=A0ABU2JXG7_9ACTN|nr:enhanced serine sensitivity protein SseB C-terminal domain-containing protein [Streptomyces sp. DSM 44915]MDT0269436.1 enhanced serine sensitivity protein SseB C-terminal domain-containing protein [Streptomyces sp. DSM 44915]